MTKVCILKPYETLNIFQENDVGGGSFERHMQFRGNSLLNTINISRLDSGSLVIEFYEIIETNIENLIKTVTVGAIGLSQFLILPFHTQMRVKIITTDFASFTLKSTCREDVSSLALLPSSSQEGFFIDGVEESTPGSPKILSTFVVAPNKTVYLASINISTNIAGYWSANIDGSIIASGRCHAGAPNSRFDFFPLRKILQAEIFTLSMTGRSPATDIGFHIQGAQV